MPLRTLLLAFVALMVLVACGDVGTGTSVKRVSLTKKAPIAPTTRSQPQRALRVTIGSIVTPAAGFSYYRDLLRYLEDKIEVPVKIIDRDSYGEINALLRDGNTDLAFVCGGPYVDGHDEFGLDLLVAPQSSGSAVYYSYIVVPKDGDVQDFEQLRGRHFAFTDPKSNSGALVPTHMLAARGETPATFFGKLTYTYAHDKSIRAVAQGVVDGAAVDSLVWEYTNRSEPQFTRKTRIIAKSPPYGTPPVVTGRDLDPRLREQLREIFLTAHEDPVGKRILDGMGIERFVVIEDSAYDSIRDMKKDLAHQKRAPPE